MAQQQASPVLDQQRRVAFRALLIFTVPAALAYSALNHQLGALELAALTAALGLLSAGLLVTVRERVPLTPLALAYMAFLYAIIFAALVEAQAHTHMQAWIAVIPVLCYLLLGVRLAMWVTSVSFVLAAVSYVIGAGRDPARLELATILNVTAPSIVLFLVCHLFAHSRLESEARAFTDALTGLGNREMLVSEFRREQKRAQRYEAPLSLVLIDLDHFKKINDSYGHHGGDAVLSFFANRLRDRLRETDIACRLGGEEFALLMPASTAPEAVKVVENLRQSLETTGCEYNGEKILFTFSAGVSELSRDGHEWTELYQVADKRLYFCKRHGRNQVLGSFELEERRVRRHGEGGH